MKQQCSAWPCQVDQASGSAKSNPTDWPYWRISHAAGRRVLNPNRWTARIRDRKSRLNEVELAGDEDGLAETRALELRVPLQGQPVGVAKRLTCEAGFGIMPMLGWLAARIG